MLTGLLQCQLVDTAPFPRGGLNSPRPVSLACEAQVFHSHAYLCLSFFFNVCCWCLLSTVSYVQQKLGQCNHLSHNAYCELLAHGDKLQQLRPVLETFQTNKLPAELFPASHTLWMTTEVPLLLIWAYKQFSSDRQTFKWGICEL